MGMQLPGELVSLLGMLGYTWPQADEEKLLEMGQSWMRFGSGLPEPVGQAQTHAERVWSDNQGSAVAAFQGAWTGGDAPKGNLDDAAAAATMVGTGLMVCAGIVLALKINVIVQLTLLAAEIAQAIATAVPTAGASLLEIPIFKQITGMIIDQLINVALDAVFSG